MRTRTTRHLTALAAATMLVLGVGSSPAGASVPVVEPEVPITPTTATITVNGHGFGHGHGMSQYGAKGAAEAGQTFQQILGFYYTGTTLGTAGGKVRVLLSADSDNNLKVASAPGLRVRDLGNGRTYKLKKKARAWRLKSVAGQTRVYFKTGHWHLYKTGGRKSLAGDGEFKASAGQLTLKLPGGTSRAYRGKLRFTNSDTVNVLRLERYLKGVIAAEMPSTWPAAALQSQAVAARTYAARERADHVSRWYDLCDTTACQVYGGVALERPQTSAAADATAGRALVFGGQYAFAQFSASSGGLLSAGSPSTPYLQAKADTWDTAAIDPYFNWTPGTAPGSTETTKSIAPLRTEYGAANTLTGVQVTSREDPTAPDKGRVVTVELHGSAGVKELTGDRFRALLALRSTYFTLNP
jgi:SpoIID/LytB domain protein